MPIRPEPTFRPDLPSPVTLLFCNLGTPDAPTTSAVRRYLGEFLSDYRVVEIPRLLWWLILHGVILRLRPKKSAAKYAKIWMPEGSPLLVWTRKFCDTLQQKFISVAPFGQENRIQVRFAMRYGNPSIGQLMSEIKRQGSEKILIMPAYPQYSATTTASISDAVSHWLAQCRNLPELRFIKHYHDHPAYIGALANQVRRHWDQYGRSEMLLMSFHGLPERNLTLGDPYFCECHKTARLLREALELPPQQVKVTFQSRLGRAKWLQPYTEPTLIELGQQGCKRVDVICPGFVVDCLETLEEIAMEGRDAYLGAGGQAFHYIPCLNDDPEWAQAVVSIAQAHLSGWGGSDDRLVDDGNARDNAKALGAPHG
jgi:ferrochelatase